ncbi:uncharacterized protein UDID_18656 [Ustilago sp. UG-2017a]|nr:uncharacterized protein UDID_18656 [Ustilago sp. UG-2017a]
MSGLGGTHFTPRGSVGDEQTVPKTVESSDGGVPTLCRQVVNVALETVGVPLSKTLNGVSIGTKAGSLGGGTTAEGVASIGQGGEAGSCNHLSECQDEGRAREGCSSGGAEAKEGRGDQLGEQRLEVRDGALRPTHKEGNHLDAKPEGVSLQCREGDDRMVRFQGHAGHPEDDSWIGGTLSSKTTTPASPLAGVPDSHNTERWLGTISIDTKVMMTPRSGASVDDDEVDGVGDKVGGVGSNLVVSTRVSSVLTNARSDPRTAVDYCLQFYCYLDR